MNGDGNNNNNTFVMGQLVSIVKELSSLSTDVDRSFQGYQKSLNAIEAAVNAIKTKNNMQDHQIGQLSQDVQALKTSYIKNKDELDKRLKSIESKLSGFVNKIDWKKVMIWVGGISTFLGMLIAFIKFFNAIKLFLGFH